MDAKEFWRRVDRKGKDKCWNWKRGKSGAGYGQISVNGKVEYAHRVAYRLAKGPIRKGLEVCHHCDNPACCNPSHLFVGSHAQNFADAARKHRMPRLETHHNAKLTIRQVRKIRALHGILSARAIAKKFGVVHQTISRIHLGKNWVE